MLLFVLSHAWATPGTDRAARWVAPLSGPFEAVIAK
jgi:hypothetical protein